VLLSRGGRAARRLSSQQRRRAVHVQVRPQKGERPRATISAGAEWTEITEGRGATGCVFLDLRHSAARNPQRLPQIRERHSTPPARSGRHAIPMPARDAPHLIAMGGIETDRVSAPNPHPPSDGKRPPVEVAPASRVPRREPAGAGKTFAARDDRVARRSGATPPTTSKNVRRQPSTKTLEAERERIDGILARTGGETPQPRAARRSTTR